MVFEQEAAFETALINLLTEKYGWEPEILRYKTEEDLIQNWKQILFENNRDVDRLNDVPLTDGEMQQILDQITRLRTPLKLNGFINGKTVAVKRDNPADELPHRPAADHCHRTDCCGGTSFLREFLSSHLRRTQP